MALVASNLRRIAYSGFLAAAGSTPVAHHGLVTNDTLATVLGANYFDGEYQRLAVGDIIFASVDMDGTPDFAILRVISITAGVVVVALESIGNAVEGVASGYKVARGVATITGSGTVVTGLATVVAIVATMSADASLTNGNAVTATIGDQAGTPAAGSVIIKVWKPTANNDTTPVASAAAVGVNWIAIGT